MTAAALAPARALGFALCALLIAAWLAAPLAIDYPSYILPVANVWQRLLATLGDGSLLATRGSRERPVASIASSKPAQSGEATKESTSQAGRNRTHAEARPQRPCTVMRKNSVAATD